MSTTQQPSIKCCSQSGCYWDQKLDTDTHRTHMQKHGSGSGDIVEHCNIVMKNGIDIENHKKNCCRYKAAMALERLKKATKSVSGKSE
ncbi:hypothetical protein CSIM01_00506 [Colletotrichum simmondsii]|uniref:Uncharacterized protein n=1 Tax=Colletotrichum simmondsii TaxID=703756 RepID=A0A135SIS4_9PEZI|nr:hypothetical protein CSIM01_00506 [Colletotrichum simmondsii]